MFLPDVCESAANRQSYPLDAMQYNKLNNTNTKTNNIQMKKNKNKSANRQFYPLAAV